MKPSYFRSLAFAYHQPIGSAEPAGCVLWFKVIPNHLRIIGEYCFSQLTEADLWAAVQRVDHQLVHAPRGDASKVAYTVASPVLFQKETSAYPGVIGQSIAETCGQLGWHLLPADPDEPNGWQRVQNWLRHDADGKPLLTIHPSCLWLIKHLRSGLSKDTAPDTLATGLPTLTALRFAVMSRPAPESGDATRLDPPVGSPAYYMKRERESPTRRFGQTR